MLDALRQPLHTAIYKACESASRLKQNILAVASVLVPPIDILSAFARYSPRMDTSLWLGLSGDSMLGLGAALECTGEGGGRFATISSCWHKVVEHSVIEGGAPPVALGGFRFDAACSTSSLWPGFGDGTLVVPRLTIMQCGTDCCRVMAAEQVFPNSDAAVQAEAALSLWQDLADGNVAHAAHQDAGVAVLIPKSARDQWHTLVHSALNTIAQGDAKKIVVARTLQAKSADPFTLPDILSRLRDDNPKAAIFAFGRRGTYFVGATPEILITAHKGVFQTMALAGSAARSEIPQQDARLGQALLTSHKDRLEHDFVVQAMLQALRPCCGKIETDSSPSLHKLPKVQHLITRFEGNILPNKSLLDVIARLHPTPAVGGVPAASALTFLRDHEGFDRGWYAGPVGWLDAEGNGEFMVALRSGVIQGCEAVLFAGCGLVAGSDPEKEYQETLIKFSTMLDGLCPARSAGSAIRRGLDWHIPVTAKKERKFN